MSGRGAPAAPPRAQRPIHAAPAPPAAGRALASAADVSSVVRAMKLSRERKFFVIICALALVALVVDRTMLSEASAGDTAGGDPSALLVAPSGHGDAARGSSTGSNRTGQPAPSAAAISDMLAQMAERNRQLLEQTPDAFQPGAGWVTPDLAQPAPPDADVRVETFAKRRVTSLVAGGRGRDGAMVDGRMVHVGQSLDGFTLVSVDGQSAFFEGRSVRVRLSLTGEPRVTPIHSPQTPAPSRVGATGDGLSGR